VQNRDILVVMRVLLGAEQGYLGCEGVLLGAEQS
jgi:hypothetical protein